MLLHPLRRFKDVTISAISDTALEQQLDNVPHYVLFVDDEPAAIRSLIRRLSERSPNYSCLEANTPQEALRLAETHSPAACVIDLSVEPNRGPESGYELLEQLLKLDPTTRVLVLTGHGAEEYGIRALNAGAASFLSKPVEPAHLDALIRDAFSFSDLKRQYAALAEQPDSSAPKLEGMRSVSESMRQSIQDGAFAAVHNQPLLILGETGVGKGVLAQAIHLSGKRRSQPFVRYQPSYGSHDLVTSELFGHTRGAFTGAAADRAGLIEAANGGTLFIDEIDELPHETQVMLLNVLQERTFRRVGSNRVQTSDFRLISATNLPFKKLVADGKLRQDFFHRVAHLTIELPPLRERRDDIPLLAEAFLRELSNRENLNVYSISQASLGKLSSYRWSGNIRELQAVIEGAAYRAQYDNRRLIEPNDFNLLGSTEGDLSSQGADCFREKVKLYEIQLIEEALRKHNNNQSKAAESLKLDRSTMRRILARARS